MVGKNSEKDFKQYNVRAIERALQILNCFDEDHPERGVSEVAQAVGLHKATAHRIIITLFNYGYLERASDGQKYRLGIQLANLGSRAVSRIDLRGEALPFMNELVKQWNESCDLSIYDHGSVFYIEVIHDKHALSFSAAVGQTLPAHCTASGKTFLAHMPSQELEQIFKEPLKKYTKNTITSPEELRQQFERIREQGYVLDDEEFEMGVRAIAAPILNRNGNVKAVLSIAGPVERMSFDRIQEMTGSLMTAAGHISERMG